MITLVSIAIITLVFAILVALVRRGGCPDCGWLVACEKCSAKFDAIDTELDRNEREE